MEVVLVSLRFSTHFHRSELPDRKMPSSEPDTLLPVEDRTRRSDSRHQHEQNHHGQPNRQRKQNARDVESDFPAKPQNASVCGADRHGCRPCNPTPRRDVAENSRVGTTLGFRLIRQSSASPIVSFHHSNQIPAPHFIGMPWRFMVVPWLTSGGVWVITSLLFGCCASGEY